MSRKKKNYKYRFQWPDLVILIILSLAALIIILPFVNVIAISLTTQKAYADTPLLLFPKVFTWENYQTLLDDGRIMIGYKTSSLLLIMALPINMMLTTMMAYGLSRKGYPGRYGILAQMAYVPGNLV